MKNFYILFLLTISYSITAQTFDFEVNQNDLGWVQQGTNFETNLTANGFDVSWEGSAATKPKIRHYNANVDANNNKILGLTFTNTTETVSRIRIIHFKGNLADNPSDPTQIECTAQGQTTMIDVDPNSASGCLARYKSTDPEVSSQRMQIFVDLTNAGWTNYNAAMSEAETELDELDMDHIQFQLVTAAPNNGGLTTQGSFLFHKIEFLSEIPSQGNRNDFTFSDDEEGFIGQNYVSLSHSPANGTITLDMGNDSEYSKLTQNGIYSVDADLYKYATVFVSENNSEKSRMTFVSPQGGNKFIGVDIIPNTTEPQVVNFDLSTTESFTNWNGEVNNFSFQIILPSEVQGEQPLPVAGTMIIDRILFSTESPLSVDLFDLENNFELYPNPVKETLYINTPLQIQSVSVINMLGQEVFRQLGNTNSLKVSNLSPGLYVLKTLHGNGLKTNRKFIIE